MGARSKMSLLDQHSDLKKKAEGERFKHISHVGQPHVDGIIHCTCHFIYFGHFFRVQRQHNPFMHEVNMALKKKSIVLKQC